MCVGGGGGFQNANSMWCETGMKASEYFCPSPQVPLQAGGGGRGTDGNLKTRALPVTRCVTSGKRLTLSGSLSLSLP